ncbi:MAG: serine protease [Rubripirellula sp.]
MPQYPPYGSQDDEHAFLTPKGMRLQRMGRKDTTVPMEFPAYPYSAPQQPRGEIGGAFQTPQAVPPPHADPFDFKRGADAPIHNILASAKYPDPAQLGLRSLAPLYESRPVPNPQANELRAIGRLFIQVSADPRRELASGSAWITGPSTIVTSAHNLYDFSTRTWSRALEFHPGFDYFSSKELPTCRITSCYIPRGYFDNPTTNHDIATCFVDRNIGDIVDAQIPMYPVEDYDFFNQNSIAVVGYPAGSGFDFGKQMWQSRGDFLFGRSNGPADDYGPVVATNFGAGASGCPWLIKDPKTGSYASVGVTSAHAKLRYVRGEPNMQALTSPYFGHRMFDRLSDNPVFHEFA